MFRIRIQALFCLFRIHTKILYDKEKKIFYKNRHMFLNPYRCEGHSGSRKFFKHEISHISLFGGQFLSAWIRIRISNPGSDPLIHLNPDPVRIWIHPVGILIHPVGIRIHPVGIRIHPVRIEIQSGSWSETLATGILRHGRPSVYSLSRITCLGNKNF